MTNLQRLGLAGAALLVLAIAALLAAPEFIDWNNHRDEIANAIEARLGRKVAIEGSLDLSLLPQPHLVAEKLRIANTPGAADPDFARIERLELRLRFAPLLGGRFEISSLVLIKPEIDLERMKDWRANWRFVPEAKPAEAETKPGSSRLLATDAGAALETIELREAKIVFRHPRAGTIVAEKVDLDASGAGGNGPFHFRASGQIGALSLVAEGAMGALDAELTPVDVALRMADGSGKISVGGALTGRDAATKFDGRLIVKAAHLDKLVAALGLKASATPPSGALDISGTLTVNLHEVAAQRLIIDIPGATLNGYASLNLEGDPQLDLKLATPRFDPAAWTGTQAKGESMGGGKTAAAPSVPDLALPAIAPPDWLDVSADLTAEAIPWHGAVIRAARVDAQLTHGEVTINQIGATLPGDSQVNLFGFLSAPGGKPLLDASFESGSDNPRALLRWLAIDLGDVPPDRLTTARLTGHIVASPGRIKLDGADLHIDGTRVGAAIDLRLPADGTARTALGASFTVDALNLDAYTPAATSAPLSPSAAASPSSAPAAKSAPDFGPLGHWFAGFDANLKAHVDQLTVRGASMRGVDLDGALDNGALVLRSLTVADLAGLRANLAGRINDLGGAPSVEGIKLEARGDHPRNALAVLGWTAPSADLGALAVTAQLSGDAANLTLDSHLELAGLVASASGKIGSPLASPDLDLAVEASDASLAGALHLAGIDYRRRAADDNVSATFHLSGDSGKLDFADLRLKLGPVNAAGKAALTMTARPRLDATLSAGEVPLDNLFGGGAGPRAAQSAKAAPVADSLSAAPRPAVESGDIPERFSHDPIALDWMRGMDGTLALDATVLNWRALRLESPSLIFTLADGRATLDKGSAKLWGGDLAATAALDAQGALSFGAKLAGADLKQAALGVADLGLAEGSLDAETDLTTTGDSPAEMIGRLSGTSSVSAHDGVLHGFDLKAADDRLKTPGGANLGALVQAAAKGGVTRFSSLTGTIKANNGIFASDDLKLTADGGTVDGAGAVNFAAYAMDARLGLKFASAPDAPPLAMRLSGPLDAPRTVLDINPLQTWLVQRGKK